MTSLIGEAEYGTRVQHVLAAFPAFDTYDATVNAPIVIDLVDDKNHGRNDDDDDCVMLSVRPRSITGTTLAYETPTVPVMPRTTLVWKMTLQIYTTVWCAKETPLIKRFSQTTLTTTMMTGHLVLGQEPLSLIVINSSLLLFIEVCWMFLQNLDN